MIVYVNDRKRVIDPLLAARMRGVRPAQGSRSNGCGPKLPGKIGRVAAAVIPDEWRGAPLWIACHWHDAAYLRGGMWADRLEADWALAVNVMQCSLYAMRRPQPINLVRFAVVAALYFTAVRLGGGLCWKSKTGPQPVVFDWSEGERPATRAQVAREICGLFTDKRRGQDAA